MIGATQIFSVQFRSRLQTGIKRRLQRGIEAISDILNPDRPPSHLRNWISPLWFDFEETGRDQLEFFVELAGLKPSDHFLDIACGIGRIAIQLSRFLNSEGRYEGFDIAVAAEHIKWCQNHISSKNPNFSFRVCDVKTSWTPESRYPVDEYVFPYEESSFEFIYAGSIFTHMDTLGSQNYLKQVARVMKTNGRFVATWLLYNKDSAQLTLGGGDAARYWKYDHGDYRTKTEQFPESSVAVEYSRVRQLYSEAGLTIIDPIRTDASYCSARIPSNREQGMHLYYCCSIIAVLNTSFKEV
ncbi:class I SAM-dependent methyltransferase [Nostoc sp. UHCC 0302]|uniref:class I SAM-dependent methyltransferase n=1 Tax=Nostoc sp. UHCC 0302 TaxID=3134896 RepID=UPI00311CDBD3